MMFNMEFVRKTIKFHAINPEEENEKASARNRKITFYCSERNKCKSFITLTQIRVENTPLF